MEPQDRHAGSWKSRSSQVSTPICPRSAFFKPCLRRTNKDPAKEWGASVFVLLGNSVTLCNGGLLKVQNPRKSQARRLPEGQELLGGLGSEMPQGTSLARDGESLLHVPLPMLIVIQQGSRLLLSV